MKYVIIFCSLSTIVGLVSCDIEDEEPTTFRGQVVFPSGDERTSEQVRVRIIGYNSRGIGSPDDGVANAYLPLNNDRFDTTFSAREVDDYFIGIDILSSDGSLTVEQSLAGDDLDCSPYDCDNLQPGEIYDLTVRVVE